MSREVPLEKKRQPTTVRLSGEFHGEEPGGLQSMGRRVGHDWVTKHSLTLKGFPGGALVNNPLAKSRDIRDMGLIPGLERSPGGGNGNPLQYSRPENSTDRGIWQSIVHGVVKSWSELSDWAHTHMIWMFVSPQNSYLEILTPKGDGISKLGLWGGVKSWRWNPHEWD